MTRYFFLLAALIATAPASAQTNEPVAVPLTLCWEFDNMSPGVTFTLYKSGAPYTTNGLAPIIANIPNKFVTIIINPGVYSFSVTAQTEWGSTPFSNIYTTHEYAPPYGLHTTNGVPNKPDQIATKAALNKLDIRENAAKNSGKMLNAFDRANLNHKPN